MLLPIADDDRRLEGTAWMTLLIIGGNLAVFFLLQQAGNNPDFTYGWSVVPKEITTGTDLTANQPITVHGEKHMLPQEPGPTPIYLTVFSAMFMHGGYLHLFGNLLYLWIFGDNVEHRFGKLPFLGLYLGAGIIGTAAQVYLAPQSVVPNLGASGAISGVLAAYLLLFPRNTVRTFVFYFLVSVPAVLVIGVWIALQFFNSMGAVMASQETVGGVAYGAHVGGFLGGGAIALALRGIISKPKALRRDRGARGR